MRGVFFVATKVHYPPEVKWKAVNMKLAGHSTREVIVNADLILHESGV